MSTASHARLFASLLGDAGTATPAEVAGRAGVSPEAAAETLSALAREGLLEEMPGGGYRAGRLDSREVRELYPAVLVLESVAVRDAPPYDAAAIRRMREANATLEAARDAEEGARADDYFHQRLTEGCGNQRLLDVVRPLRQALMAYERVYFTHAGAAVALGRAARGDHRAAGAGRAGGGGGTRARELHHGAAGADR